MNISPIHVACSLHVLPILVVRGQGSGGHGGGVQMGEKVCAGQIWCPTEPWGYPFGPLRRSNMAPGLSLSTEEEMDGKKHIENANSKVICMSRRHRALSFLKSPVGRNPFV